MRHGVPSPLPPMSALVGAALVGFQSCPLSDEVLEQAAPLAKLPLPNACRGGHRLELPARA
jgi:xanthosine utilization system XapX-like protein